MSDAELLDTTEQANDATGANSVDSTEKKKPGKFEMNLWDVFMIVSFFCVLFACFLLLMELRTFSDWPSSSPWNVSEAKVE